MNKMFAILLSAFVSCTSAWAAETPVVFSVTKLGIRHVTQNQVAGQIFLKVTVRDAESFYRNDGWFDVKSLKDGEGILLLFGEPSQTAIEQSAHYAPMDVLMVDNTGTILSIAPSIILAEMDGPIYPPQPIKAFLLLGGGSSERLAIQPGDDVIYEAFKKPQKIIDTPQQEVPAMPAQERLETPEQPIQGTVTEPEKKPEEAQDSLSLEKIFTPESKPPVRRKPAAQPSAP